MLKYLRPDTYTLLLTAVVVAASLAPCRGETAIIFAWITKIAIVLLFFMHGARLSRESVLQGIGRWQLHLGVLASTFLLFPLLGLGISLLPDSVVDPGIKIGMVFLAILPSTVQSSIAFTAMAGGNVAAAVCSASLSNIIAVVLTPLLAGLLISARFWGEGPDMIASITSVATTLLLPFVLGHLSRPLTGAFVDRHKTMLGRLDRGSILLVVYTAFSAAVVDGIWSRLSGVDIGITLLLSALLLAIVLASTTMIAHVLKLDLPDRIALVFCGSKKSLASGVPMAAALFPAAQVGMIILPLMLFHQLQLIVCTMLARTDVNRP